MSRYDGRRHAIEHGDWCQGQSCGWRRDWRETVWLYWECYRPKSGRKHHERFAPYLPVQGWRARLWALMYANHWRYSRWGRPGRWWSRMLEAACDARHAEKGYLW